MEVLEPDLQCLFTGDDHIGEVSQVLPRLAPVVTELNLDLLPDLERKGEGKGELGWGAQGAGRAIDVGPADHELAAELVAVELGRRGLDADQAELVQGPPWAA